MIEKQTTIAGTMRAFMESGPAVADFPSYKSLNDFVGNLHGLGKGKCQALAGEKAWVWTADQGTGTWRKATEAEVEACRAKAATKNNGGPRKSKVLSDEDRAALDAQVTALQGVNNPALVPLLEDLKGKQALDALARKGLLKDRLQAAVEKLHIEIAVGLLEKAVIEAFPETAASENA